MKKALSKFMVLVMMVSLTVFPASCTEAATGKELGLVKKSIKVKVGQTKRIRTRHVTGKTKVTIRQSASGKRKLRVKWEKKSKRLKIIGRRAGETVVAVRFKKGKQTAVSRLKVVVWQAESQRSETPAETLPPVGSETETPTESEMPEISAASSTAASSEDSSQPSAVVTLEPYPFPEPDYTDDTMPVKDIYADYFMVGAAINGSSLETMALNHAGMSGILKKHFNSTVLSNLMKPAYTLDQEASQKSVDGMPVCKFDTCDPALQFCMENGIKMRGHTLVWHNQAPEWFFHVDYDTTKEVVDAETMDRRMESYIRQVITHCQDYFPGVIYCWDVVNECVCTDAGSYIVTSGGWKLRASTKQDNDFTHEDYVKNYWYATMGESYVEKAFTYARKYADEDVKLFYNDYNVFMIDKMNNIYQMVQELKGKGLIDGIGLQPTVLLTWPELNKKSSGSFRTCLEKYAELGLELQVTELSFKIDAGKVSEDTLLKQSERYKEMMELLVEEDTASGGPCNITSVTVFGICDDYPLYDDFEQNLYLWDKNCNPKSCFYSFIEPGLARLQSK
ncbi:MAG: endo-1,4-beta-xylanase [Roseburia sp.]|nr:endo-1,4-beta-xylanase [Roseburia sp.]